MVWGAFFSVLESTSAAVCTCCVDVCHSLLVSCRLCTVMVTQSLCYPVLGNRVAVGYPERSQITRNSSLNDYEVLHMYERAIASKLQFYQDNGVQVESQGCRESVLVSICLELYPVCSASPAKSSCSLPCDSWKLHVGSTCTCSESETCQSLLQQVADVCPFSEGETLFTNSGVQCQRLSSGECSYTLGADT